MSNLALRPQASTAIEVADEGRETGPPPSSYGVAIRSEIEAQVATANRYPRSIKTFLSEATTNATLTQQVAQQCMYSVPRGGKQLVGPSVRLAEIMLSSYKHLRVQSQVVGEDGRFVTVVGTCLDTQNNIGVSIEVKRRITDKHGQTFKEDMIGVTAAAASSIAMRNAIFRVIPNAYRDMIFEAVKQVAVGKGETFTQTRDGWIEYFVGQGISTARIFDTVGVKGLEDINQDHLATFIGISNRIEDGEDIQTLFFVPESTPVYVPPKTTTTPPAPREPDAVRLLSQVGDRDERLYHEIVTHETAEYKGLAWRDHKIDLDINPHQVANHIRKWATVKWPDQPPPDSGERKANAGWSQRRYGEERDAFRTEIARYLRDKLEEAIATTSVASGPAPSYVDAVAEMVEASSVDRYAVHEAMLKFVARKSWVAVPDDLIDLVAIKAALQTAFVVHEAEMREEIAKTVAALEVA